MNLNLFSLLSVYTYLKFFATFFSFPLLENRTQFPCLASLYSLLTIAESFPELINSDSLLDVFLGVASFLALGSLGYSDNTIGQVHVQ